MNQGDIKTILDTYFQSFHEDIKVSQIWLSFILYVKLHGEIKTFNEMSAN